MPIRLRREEIMIIKALAGKGQNHCEIARTLGVTEGAVRCHLRRTAQGAQSLHRTCSGDGRKARPFKAEALSEVIQGLGGKPPRPEASNQRAGTVRGASARLGL